jgi:hypothetical protein
MNPSKERRQKKRRRNLLAKELRQNPIFKQKKTINKQKYQRTKFKHKELEDNVDDENF